MLNAGLGSDKGQLCKSDLTQSGFKPEVEIEPALLLIGHPIWLCVSGIRYLVCILGNFTSQQTAADRSY